MSKRPGPKSKFTEPQDAFIASFFPELWTEFSTHNTADVTSWKQRKIKDIMASPLFAGQLAGPSQKNGVDEDGWRNRILKKFNAYITTKKDARPGNPWLQFEPLTALEFFGLEQSATILAAARANPNTGARMFDRLAASRREMWDALGADVQADYGRRAKIAPPSVAANQVDFPRATARALNGISRGGLVGNMEMMLFWGYRDEAGDLHHGVIDAHSADNTRNMADETKDWETSFEIPWVQFAEKTIPRPTDSSAFSPGNLSIPRNSSGIPIFPSFDMQKFNAEAVTQILERYLKELWAHGNESEVPWDSMTAEGPAHYDVSHFTLPFQLKAPRTLTTAQTFTLAEYFNETSGLESDDPFMFRTNYEEDDEGARVVDEDVRLSEGDEEVEGAHVVDEDVRLSEGDEEVEGAEAVGEDVQLSKGDEEVTKLSKKSQTSGPAGPGEKARSGKLKQTERPAQQRRTGGTPAVTTRDGRIVNSPTKRSREHRTAHPGDKGKESSKKRSKGGAPEALSQDDETTRSQTRQKRKGVHNSEMRAPEMSQDQGTSKKRLNRGASVEPLRKMPDRGRSSQVSRPEPPHRTGRPGWDYALETPEGKFLGWTTP